MFAALACPSFYPHRPASVVVRETHISWVFLAGERAYKLKKPVVLPFLDYRTPARRREMCREEVRLNRRLAPNVYLGVRAVARGANGFELAAEDDPRAVDYLVEMRRYDEQRTLAARLARGELKRAEVEAVAVALADFHAHARSITVRAPLRALERRIAENFHELLALTEQRGENARTLELMHFTHAFLGAHARSLEARARRGRVVEGHGDLRAEHVLLDGSGQIVDCVEFDPALRELDVADDLAFLVMDLAARGGEQFAQALVRAYRGAGGDPGADALIAFYAAHRALVRAKVALLRAKQEAPSSAVRGREHAAARDLVELAERFAWQARLPLAIVVCGVPAAGKSTLAQALAAASGLPHLSSDATRKQLVGVDRHQRAPDAGYSPAFSRRTYAELGHRAAGVIVSHGGVLIDATFRHRADRDAFADAFADAAPVLFVECRAPARVLAERAARRDRNPARVSDASVTVVARERGSFEPLDEVAPEAHLMVRTDRPCDGVVTELVALLDRRIGWLARIGPVPEPATRGSRPPPRDPRARPR